MHADEIRWLSTYDRWATRRVLDVLGGLAVDVWGISNAVGERGLGSILDMINYAEELAALPPPGSYGRGARRDSGTVRGRSPSRRACSQPPFIRATAPSRFRLPLRRESRPELDREPWRSGSDSS